MAEECQVTGESSDNTPETFMRTELQSALQEQLLLGGVSSFDLLPDNDEDPGLFAEARAVLLEGTIVHVRLSSRGYEVCMITPLFDFFSSRAQLNLGYSSR
jgi:hypothetical protein